jgi:hypothetical protein
MSASAAKRDPDYPSRRPPSPSTPGSVTGDKPAPLRRPPLSEEPARHILRRRTVEWFKQHPYAPGGAIPSAVMKVVGGPMMWTDQPVKASQFTLEQRDLLLRAYREIKDLHAAAGGEGQAKVSFREGLGLMPVNSSNWPYQSEEWAAERALHNRITSRSVSAGLKHSERLDAELSDAYFVVTTWIDYVKDGLLDASAIYEDEEDD